MEHLCLIPVVVLLQAGQAAPDVQVGAASSRKETIRSIYGRSLSEELLPLEYKAEPSDADSLQCNVTGLVSNANFSMKKVMFILFINHRLVDSANVKRVR